MSSRCPGARLLVAIYPQRYRQVDRRRLALERIAVELATGWGS